MSLDSAVRILVPEQDSHFRLLPCGGCGSDNVAYVQYKLGVQEPWRVRCFDCGHTVDKHAIFRHEAQIAWNKEESKKSTENRKKYQSPVWASPEG